MDAATGKAGLSLSQSELTILHGLALLGATVMSQNSVSAALLMGALAETLDQAEASATLEKVGAALGLAHPIVLRSALS